MPRLPSPLGREVEQLPHRPDEINMSWVLPSNTRRKHQFGAVAVPDSPPATNEHVQRRRLIVICVLALIVPVVRIPG